VGAEVRDYQPEDFAAVKAIHDASQIDYTFPDLTSPLFLVSKVLCIDGIIRACIAGYLQIEAHLWLDKSDWATPEEKLAAIKELDAVGMHEAWLQGINHAVLWLPPELERFGKRLEQLGFSKDRDGWRTYSKQTS
jgi:hypothetical protein